MKRELLDFLLDRIRTEAGKLSREGISFGDREKGCEEICRLVGYIKNLASKE